MESNEPTQQALSRKQLLARAGAMTAGVGVLGTLTAGPAFGAPTCTETVQNIIDIAAIAEGLAVTTYYHGIKSPHVFNHLTDQRPYLRAALSAEDSHLKTLIGAGAAVPQKVYHYTPGTFASVGEFTSILIGLERAFISAYGAAVTRFSQLNQPALANLAARILGVEAEHRALARDTAGDVVPNNLCLEPALFTCVSEAATALTPFLNGSSHHTVAKVMPTAAQLKRAIGPHACA